MARSYRHTPIVSYTCAKSDKPGKVLANRAMRAAERKALGRCLDFDELVMPIANEVSNVWDFPKDGKHYMKNRLAPWYAKAMRK